MAKRILKAIQHTDHIELEVVDIDATGTEIGAPYAYTLTDNDPYGDAPALRDELHRMVDAGEIEIEAAEEDPEDGAA